MFAGIASLIVLILVIGLVGWAVSAAPIAQWLKIIIYALLGILVLLHGCAVFHIPMPLFLK